MLVYGKPNPCSDNEDLSICCKLFTKVASSEMFLQSNVCSGQSLGISGHKMSLLLNSVTKKPDIRKSIKTETLLDRVPSWTETPRQSTYPRLEIPLDRDPPWTDTLLDRDPLDRDRDPCGQYTSENITFANFVCGLVNMFTTITDYSNQQNLV